MSENPPIIHRFVDIRTDSHLATIHSDKIRNVGDAFVLDDRPDEEYEILFRRTNPLAYHYYVKDKADPTLYAFGPQAINVASMSGAGYCCLATFGLYKQEISKEFFDAFFREFIYQHFKPKPIGKGQSYPMTVRPTEPGMYLAKVLLPSTVETTEVVMFSDLFREGPWPGWGFNGGYQTHDGPQYVSWQHIRKSDMCP